LKPVDIGGVTPPTDEEIVDTSDLSPSPAAPVTEAKVDETEAARPEGFCWEAVSTFFDTSPTKVFVSEATVLPNSDKSSL